MSNQSIQLAHARSVSPRVQTTENVRSVKLEICGFLSPATLSVYIGRSEVRREEGAMSPPGLPLPLSLLPASSDKLNSLHINTRPGSPPSTSLGTETDHLHIILFTRSQYVGRQTFNTQHYQPSLHFETEIFTCTTPAEKVISDIGLQERKTFRIRDELVCCWV